MFLGVSFPSPWAVFLGVFLQSFLFISSRNQKSWNLPQRYKNWFFFSFKKKKLGFFLLLKEIKNSRKEKYTVAIFF